MTRVSEIFSQILIWKIFKNYYHVPSVWIVVRQWNCLWREIGILDILLRQWNGVLKILMSGSLAKFLLKFAIVLKSFENFCRFLSLTIITGQRSFLSLADGLHQKYPETKIVFEHFIYCKFWKIFSWILHFQFFFLYDLFTNKSRKLKVVDSNLIMEQVLSSLSFSLCLLAFLYFSFSLTFNLALSLSLSLSLSP